MFSLREWAEFIVSVSDEFAALFLIFFGAYVYSMGNTSGGFTLMSWGFVYLTGKSMPKVKRRAGGLPQNDNVIYTEG